MRSSCTATKQRTTRHALDQILVELAVTIGGRDLHIELVAFALAFQLALQARNEVAVAMDIGERLAAG